MRGGVQAQLPRGESAGRSPLPLPGTELWTKGFEKSVGSRTDFRFIASKSFNRVEVPTHENYDFGFFPSLNDEHFFVRYDHPNTKELIGGMINNMNGNN